jgi:hypothetical protein
MQTIPHSSFLPIYFGEFQQESCASLWGHYRSKIVGVFSRPLSKALGSTTNILWWYKLSLYRRLCPICFSKELGSNDSIFVL